MLIEARGFKPRLADTVFWTPSSQLVGDVEIGAQSSIWFNCTLRGDVMPIRIGERSNIQDNSVIHGTLDYAQAEVGNDVTVGHSVILHGCKIMDRVLVGMGSVIMDKAEIPSDCIVGAGSLVTEGFKGERGTLILGRPAKVVRPLNPEEREFILKSAKNYMMYTTWYKWEKIGER